MRALKSLSDTIVRGNAWKKFVDPTVSRGKTIWPKSQAELERIGVRFDYDGEVTQDGVVYHKYQCQPNAGKVPSSVREWREGNGGTHAVMASFLIKKDGTKEDVQNAVDEAIKGI